MSGADCASSSAIAPAPQLAQSSESVLLHATPSADINEFDYADLALPPLPPSPRPGLPNPLSLSMSGHAEGVEERNDNLDHPLQTSSDIMPTTTTQTHTPPVQRGPLLPLDRSAYSDPCLPVSAVTQSSTSLEELAHLIRFQRYQDQRRCQSRIRLHRWLVSAGLSARLVSCGQSSYKTLMDYFRNGDKKYFADLHNALYDVRSSCDAIRRYALLEPDLEQTKQANAPGISSFSTFMHEIPQNVRGEILAFLSEIRTNPDFLAGRILTLSDHEMVALTSSRPTLDLNEFAVMSSSKPFKKNSVSNYVNPVETLLSFQRHDPLSSLIFTVFANSSGPDSPEDLRRNDAWATTCARLITETSRPSAEKLLRGVLDVWAEMRDWPVKHNLELYLMQTLQEGQFLLKVDEDSPGKTGIAMDKPTKQLEFAAEEFFERSVKRLFAVIDNEPSAGGLPEGVVEIGHAILKKLGPSKRLRTRAEWLIFYCWFFSTFLPRALIFPETHGMMMSFHISAVARERILKEIASRARKQVLAVWNNVASSVTVFPEVKPLVDRMLDRVRKSRHSKALLPIKAITAPKPTVEVQPFLVICPADIVTLVKALFPERKVGARDIPSGLLSSASSISGVSTQIGFSSTPRDSVLSQSVSSVNSAFSQETLDLTSALPEALEALTQDEREAAMIRPVPTEEYGRKLRNACAEMSRILGAEVMAGSCHPCADRWAVLHISKDGKELLTRMRKDSEDENDPDDESPDSDSELESNSNGVLDIDYHQLKDAVVKLLSEYELPKNLTDQRAFSNNGNSPRRRRTGGNLRTTPVPLDDKAQTIGLISAQRASSRNQRSPSNDGEDSVKEKPYLEAMLEAAFIQCQTRNEFVEAYLWHRTLDQLKKLSLPSLTKNSYGPLLHHFARGLRDSMSKAFSAIEEFEAWFVWLKQSQDRHNSKIENMMLSFKNLRDKTWYKSAVLTSAAYEEAKGVALALKLMTSKLGQEEAKPPVHRRGFSRGATGSLFKSESHVFDLMAASLDYGGPNKLADEQVDVTANWMKHSRVFFNACTGEERIHRFCYELHRCANRLVGEIITEAPVLWSSELFRKERQILDGGNPDFWLTGMGLCLSEDEDDDQKSRPSAMSLDIVKRRRSKDDHGLTAEDASSVHLMDAQDFFGPISGISAIDSSITFWSPFQAQGQSQPKEKRGSTSKTQKKSTAAMEEEKQRFLQDLKKSLVGLLLSDLGMMLFYSGSETDVWFTEEIVDECFGLVEAEERRKKLRLARKKSMKNVKQHKNASSDARSDGSPIPPVQTDSQKAGRPLSGQSKKAALLEFHYQNNFRLLLRKFSTHPNPYVKLDALYDLYYLVEQSIHSRPLRSIKPPSDVGRDSPGTSTPTQTHSERNSPLSQSARVGDNSNINEVLQTLLRDPKMRPATFFRDLQYVSAFIPSVTLHTTYRGKAFCEVFAAAMNLKNTVIKHMVEIADMVVQINTQERTASASMSSANQDHYTAVAEHAAAEVAAAEPAVRTLANRYSMADAAKFFLLAAKEGNAAAEREVAIFYLTQSELLPRAVPPMVRTRDVFKGQIPPASASSAVQSGPGGNNRRFGVDDAVRSDPITIGVARHWMERACKGGDELATKYLRDQDDLDKIPGGS